MIRMILAASTVQSSLSLSLSRRRRVDVDVDIARKVSTNKLHLFPCFPLATPKVVVVEREREREREREERGAKNYTGKVHLTKKNPTKSFAAQKWQKYNDHYFYFLAWKQP